MMKEEAAGIDDTVKMPEYEYDKQLSIYRLLDNPNEKLFRQVGFNN